MRLLLRQDTECRLEQHRQVLVLVLQSLMLYNQGVENLDELLAEFLVESAVFSTHCRYQILDFVRVAPETFSKGPRIVKTGHLCIPKKTPKCFSPGFNVFFQRLDLGLQLFELAVAGPLAQFGVLVSRSP